MSGLFNSSYLENAFTSGSAVTISGYIAQRPVMTFRTLFVTLAPPVIAKVDVLEPRDPSFGQVSHCPHSLSCDKEAKTMHERVMQTFISDIGRVSEHHKH